MIVGIGVDIVEIGRIQEILQRNPGFVKRILSERERAGQLPAHERRLAEYVAGRFAAKEAAAKAAGTGIGKLLSFHDIEVGNEASGKPFIHLSSEAAKRLFPDYPTTTTIHLSISHSREYAVAQVIIER